MSEELYLELELVNVLVDGKYYDVLVDAEVVRDEFGFLLDGYYVLDVFRTQGEQSHRVPIDTLSDDFNYILEDAIINEAAFKLEEAV